MKKISPLPETMLAIAIENEKLVNVTRPVPGLSSGDVLIRTYAAGVNRPDLLQRRGLYAPPEGVTDIPGLEVAGVIVDVAKGVRNVKIGQEVTALLAGGGYAEYCVAPAVQCLPRPRNLGWMAAAGIPETFFTVWSNLFDTGRLEKGQRVLVHGGASGIGTAAIQMAKAFGCRVFVTAGSDEKCLACKKLGAFGVINYNKQDFVTEINRETGRQGVDVILDMVGGDYVARNLKILAPGGRHISIAMQKGRQAEIDIYQIMSKRLILTGSTLRPQSHTFKGAIAKALKKNVWPLIERKKISPVIDRIFPLTEAQAAHDYLEAGKHFGKIILKVAGSDK